MRLFGLNNQDKADGDGRAVRLAGVFLPTVVTAHLLTIWLPKGVAWAISIFAWSGMVLMPGTLRERRWFWLIVLSILSLLAFILATFFPNAF
jgi:hypothetical protein